MESANANSFTRKVFTPMSRRARASCATASTARPKNVRVRNASIPSTIVTETTNGTTSRSGKSTKPSRQIVSE